MTNIEISIPVELTAAMVIRAGIITSEAHAAELAAELHDLIPEIVAAWAAHQGRFGHPPTPLEIADFQLACWRQALVNASGLDGDSPDSAEAEWISVEIAALTADDGGDLFLRWLVLGDIVTGSDVSDIIRGAEGGLQ
jgi:hypothetical protein